MVPARLGNSSSNLGVTRPGIGKPQKLVKNLRYLYHSRLFAFSLYRLPSSSVMLIAHETCLYVIFTLSGRIARQGGCSHAEGCKIESGLG